MTEPVSAWERRFRAPTLSLPTWSRHAPGRTAFVSKESGAYQAHVWDMGRDVRRQVTHEPVGVDLASTTADGSGVAWFHDASGDEHGRWMVEPFDGGDPLPLVPGVPDGWPAGLALGASVRAVGTADRHGTFAIHVAVDGGPSRVLYRHREAAGVAGPERVGFNLAGLASDESLLLVEHTEHGDPLHPALRAFDPRTGEVAGDLWDGRGLGLRGAAWSPVHGDLRVAVIHERDGADRPAIWDLGTGERTDLEVPTAGTVDVLDWWPDASALLLRNTFEGRDELYRLALGDGSLARIDHPTGIITDARVRPDGRVWMRATSAAEQARILDDTGAEVIAAEGERAPDGRPYVSWRFTNPHGQEVHGFYVTPAGAGPFPLVMDVHGGPHWLWEDTFAPAVQALVDHGYAVGLANYRGSTGYTRAWRDAIIGNPGFTELEDVMAGVEDLIARGIADPSRLVLGGASWGGYLTLLGLGLYPDRFAAGVAEVPVADYVAAYEDEAPVLQAMDRGLFGGSPEERPDAYRERSPITYVDRVDGPLLVLAGANDSRCPIRQVDNYLVALRARGVEAEVYRYDTGHGSMVTDEQVRQMRVKLGFLLRHVPTGARV
jgi:acetyl esterase/lipase